MAARTADIDWNKAITLLQSTYVYTFCTVRRYPQPNEPIYQGNTVYQPRQLCLLRSYPFHYDAVWTKWPTALTGTDIVLTHFAQNSKMKQFTSLLWALELKLKQMADSSNKQFLLS